MKGYSYSKLNTTQKNMYDQIVHAIENMEKSVYLSGPALEAQMVLETVCVESCELFWCALEFCRVLTASDGGSVVLLKYLEGKKAMEVSKRMLSEKVEEVFSTIGLERDQSDLVKVSKIHDYLIGLLEAPIIFNAKSAKKSEKQEESMSVLLAGQKKGEGSGLEQMHVLDDGSWIAPANTSSKQSSLAEATFDGLQLGPLDPQNKAAGAKEYVTKSSTNYNRLVEDGGSHYNDGFSHTQTSNSAFDTHRKPSRKTTELFAEVQETFEEKEEEYAEPTILPCLQFYPQFNSICSALFHYVVSPLGLARTFQFLCQQAQVEALLCAGFYEKNFMSVDQKHVWNAVLVDDDYYYVDLSLDRLNRIRRKDPRTWFLVSEWNMQDHSQHTLGPECRAEPFNYGDSPSTWFKDEAMNPGMQSFRFLA